MEGAELMGTELGSWELGDGMEEEELWGAAVLELSLALGRVSGGF